MAKIYAIKVGMQTGKFYSWDEVKPLVTGYPGAQFKGFSSEAEADAYLGSGSSEVVSTVQVNKSEEPVKKGKKKKENTPDDADTRRFLQESLDHPDKAIAYVDGSFDKRVPVYSYGAIIFFRGEKIVFKKAGTDPRIIDLWNVAGEMSGAVKAVRFCKEHNIKNLDIYHDYVGIAAWAKNEWKAKTAGTEAYKRFMMDEMKNICITFHKVKGHTGVELNEEADRLAKEAIEEFKRNRGECSA